MANYNKVILVGNLTRDPQVRYTPNGTAVAEFGLAVNRQWKTPEGESKEDVCFIDVSAFGRLGEIISEYKAKGDPILLEGRLQMQSWQGQDGQKRIKHVVVAEVCQFLDRRGQPAGGAGGPSDQAGGSARPPRQAPQGSQGSQGGAQGAGPGPAQSTPPAKQDGPGDSFGGEDIPF